MLRSLASLTIAIVVAACTFPSPDVIGTGPPCDAPTACRDNATICSMHIQQAAAPCQDGCHNDQACKDMCTQQARNSCVQDCISCSSQNGCSNAKDNCSSLVP